MWAKPPPEVSCVSSSVESFYRGSVAGGIFGIVFAAPGPVLAKLASPLQPALLAGSWCFFTSFASCVMSRAGLGLAFTSVFAGMFSGSMISIAARWPRDQAVQVMCTSAFLSVLSHYAAEGQHQEVASEDFSLRREGSSFQKAFALARSIEAPAEPADAHARS
mmetsp:Transcript_28419/g.42963  ORF Transcript_28419/g.42963 Transcript_28419/m.42963 type:complete len:163 (+) Transcript_28419:127-615(+)|eukprot:CAMPEP_0194764548 /NCGR_PEP_ID=MMETSP0323_2-20130528/23406_1 /TAXON_ID=2866 ORGANISM="Crypthecodinium cohnii, Strain Seligo" /NCGR_SAMPLE_ID=MMETSP0323_2 /ASSEMBLY_ACC=CAM_ASM_000346 /LENGTH=162 /DNA_ID=CAMNT_0039692029 /DNA_START=98 /DNA_END=586 /DNA_ORIENTATION=-